MILRAKQNPRDNKGKRARRQKSKFTAKYSERIQSIQESDSLREEKRKRIQQEQKEKSEFLNQINKEK